MITYNVLNEPHSKRLTLFHYILILTVISAFIGIVFLMNEKNTAMMQNEPPPTTSTSPQTETETEIASTSTTTTTEKIDIVNVNGESIVFNGEGDVKINGGHISVKDGTITIEGMHG